MTIAKPKSKRRRQLVVLICVVLVFSTFLSSTTFAYYQNATASVLFTWDQFISNSNPRITVYGRNPSSGAEENNTIYNMNGLNGHCLYIDDGYRAVFCLNPNQAAHTNYLDGEAFKADRWGRLTTDQQELILRALCCGYPNTTDRTIKDQTGTNSMSAAHAQHLALQAMVFNIRCNFVVKDGDGIKASRSYNDTDSFDARVAEDYENFHAAYANLFARMNSTTSSVGIPSFSTLSTETATADKTIMLEPDSSGNYSTTVTDSNGGLGYYNFALLNGDGFSFSASGNKLTITATPEAAAKLSSATRKGNVSSSEADINLTVDNLSFYVASNSGDDDYQTMVEYVSSETEKTYKSVYLMLRAETKGYIKVIKSSALSELTDGNDAYSLAGAVFSIYATRADAEAKKNAVGTITTDANGEGRSDALAPATYYVREIVAPLNFGLNNEIQTVKIPAGETVKLYAEDPPTTKDFTLMKRPTYTGFTTGNSGYSLKGAQYGVYASEADAKSDKNRLETLTTNANGDAASGKRYALGKKLYFKELTASPGYFLDPNIYSLTIASSGGNAITVKEVPGSDSGHLRICKVSDEGTKPETITESAAVFKVEFFANADWSGKATRTWFFKTKDGVVWLNDKSYLDASQSNAEFYLDADGAACFPIGTVKIAEHTAPTGFVRSDKVLLARINQDSNGGPVVWHWETEDSGDIGHEPEGATVKNTRIRGNLEVIKKDKDEDIYLSGAGFRLFDSTGNQVAEGYTDTSGKLSFKDLLSGEYTYQEFKAPKGFVLDKTVYSFSVTENGATVKHTRVNERRPGTIEVLKRDTKGNPLAEVAFLLEYSTDEGSTWQPVFSRTADEKNITRGGCTSPGLTDGQLVTAASGKVRFTGLRADGKILYRLTETAAPEGCALLAGSLYVGTLPVESDNIYASDAEVFGNRAFVYSLYITATNDPVFRLPETGGFGFGYLPLAMLLCAAPVPVIIKKSNRKGENA